MQDPVQPPPRRLVCERLRGQRGPVERAVRVEAVLAERLGDLGETFGAGLDDFAGEPVGVDEDGAVLGEAVRHRRFPRTDTAGQAHTQHDDQPSQRRVTQPIWGHAASATHIQSVNCVPCAATRVTHPEERWRTASTSGGTGLARRAWCTAFCIVRWPKLSPITAATGSARYWSPPSTASPG